MILGSHNSWSYLPVLKWWMRPLAFTARCQNIDIRKQYELGVRCFDLRVRFNGQGVGTVAHSIVEYYIKNLLEDLEFLDINNDCFVRVINEVRVEKDYTKKSVEDFVEFCAYISAMYPNIRFWCGRNLYNWQKDYDFGDDPTCEEKYGSVSNHKWLYAWWPWLYARLRNRKIREQGTDKNILLMDYINI